MQIDRDLFCKYLYIKHDINKNDIFHYAINSVYNNTHITYYIKSTKTNELLYFMTITEYVNYSRRIKLKQIRK
jgi:hypothetical protein